MQKKTRIRNKEYSTLKPLEIHTNLFGPTKTKGLNGERYFMIVVDNYSKITCVTFLREKSKSLDNFNAFKSMVENELDTKIKCLRYDKRGEFT